MHAEFWNFKQVKSTYSWAYIWRKTRSERIHAPQCSLQNYLRFTDIYREMDEENMVHIYNGILHRITNEWNHAICSKIDGPRDCHIEWSQRRRNITWHLSYVEYKKKWYKWAYSQNRNRLIDFKNELMVAGGREDGEEIIRGFGIDIYTLLYI